MATLHEQLIHNLEYLKLSEMINHLGEELDLITSNNKTFTEGLISLTNKEIEKREKSMMHAMVKVGGFPHNKSLDDFDFSYQSDLNEKEIREFLNHRFIHECSNIIFLGTSGVGKTHLATSIGISVAKNRMQTYYIKCHDLIQQLKKAKLENRLGDRLKHFTKYRLLIIDEMGYLPIDKEDSKLFFQLIDRRYEKKSTIITTNINFNRWDEVFQDATIANAIADRLLHHSSVVTITGNSYRLKNYLET